MKIKRDHLHLFFIYSTASPTDFYNNLNTLSLHDALPIYAGAQTYNNTPVEMVFHHALSKVNFIFIIKGESNLNLTINSVSIVSIPTKADFTFNISATDVPDYFTVSNQNIDTTVINTLAQPVSLKAADSDVTSSSIEGLYLIPHKLNLWSYSTETTWPMQGSYINIDGEITGVTTYTGNIAIPIPTDCTEWQPGISYTYSITFGDISGPTGGAGYNPDLPDSGKPVKILIPIDVNVQVDSWVTDIYDVIL